MNPAISEHIEPLRSQVDEYLLSRVATVRRLDDGSILLANSGSASLRHYDAGGRFIRSIGGQGEGPGEFRGLSWFAVLPGDSLVAFDRMLRRVSLFDLDGAFLGSTAVTPNVPDGVPTPLASWTDGSLLLEISHSSSRSQRRRPFGSATGTRTRWASRSWSPDASSDPVIPTHVTVCPLASV